MSQKGCPKASAQIKPSAVFFDCFFLADCGVSWKESSSGAACEGRSGKSSPRTHQLTLGFLGRQARSSHQKTLLQEPGTEVVLFGGVDAKEPLSKTFTSLGVEHLLKAAAIPSLSFIHFHHSSVLDCAFIMLFQVLLLDHMTLEVPCDPSCEKPESPLDFDASAFKLGSFFSPNCSASRCPHYERTIPFRRRAIAMSCQLSLPETFMKQVWIKT